MKLDKILKSYVVIEGFTSVLNPLMDSKLVLIVTDGEKRYKMTAKLSELGYKGETMIMYYSEPIVEELKVKIQ